MIFTLTGPTNDDQLFHDFEVAQPVEAGQPYQWSPIRGLIDTGAQGSHIGNSVAQRLTLPLLSQSKIAGVYGSPTSMDVRRIITRWTSQEGHKLVKPFQMVVGLAIAPSKAEAVIGMDMLKHFTLLVSFARFYTMVGDFERNVFEP